MSKVEIVGPKTLLMEVLETLRRRGVFHPEAELREPLSAEEAQSMHLLAPEDDAVRDKAWLEQLRGQIRELLEMLPERPVREVYLRPEPIVAVLGELVEKHLRFGRDLGSRQNNLRDECQRWSRFAEFWKAFEPLMEKVAGDSQLDFMGVVIRDPSRLPELERLLRERAGGLSQLDTAQLEDGTLIGLIATERALVDQLRRLVEAEKIPEMAVPGELEELSFAERGRALARHLTDCRARLDRAAAELTTFAGRWRPIYQQALLWIEQRLAVYQASATAYQTGSCFFIFGWVISQEVPTIREVLEREFAGIVVLSERKLLVEDLERAPVVLSNPPYFEPFELLTRVLPLPRYSSYDPTPFIGLFFPLLFGMTLGDSGYGILLAIMAAVLVFGCRARPNLVAAGKIFGVCAAYTIVFGALYGELFGDLGMRLFDLHPLWFDRAEAIVPMLVFALAVGGGHVLIGLLVGLRSDWRRHRYREGVFKLVSALVLALSGLLILDLVRPQVWLASTPLLLTVALLIPLLIAAGGFLAPLELLKGIGNVISYVRIMAIGISSVLLAYVANRLGGMTGDVVLGILVAGVLHAFNLVLGVFAPTVHVLRLHYVEFFSKFLELGGRHFEPLGKKPV